MRAKRNITLGIRKRTCRAGGRNAGCPSRRTMQEMESAGNMAEGFAEVFNNILTAIMGCGKILQMRIDRDNPSIKYVDQILAAAQKAANLTQGLLAFSRKQAISPKIENVNAVVWRIKGILSQLLGEGRELKILLADADLPVLSEKGQIEQVLMNLATNARDAMPYGGMLTIVTELRELDAKSAKTCGCGTPGTYALISVTDTGAGMNARTKARIFEPFFTTRGAGGGRGLGLAIVYGIIKQHNGGIAVHSEPGKGATFTVYLPLAPQQTAAGRFSPPG